MAARRMSSTGKIEDEEEEGRRKSDKEMTGERKKEAQEGPDDDNLRLHGKNKESWRKRLGWASGAGDN